MSREYNLYTPIPLEKIKQHPEFTYEEDGDNKYLIHKTGGVSHLIIHDDMIYELCFYGMNDESPFMNILVNEYSAIFFDDNTQEFLWYNGIKEDDLDFVLDNMDSYGYDAREIYENYLTEYGVKMSYKEMNLEITDIIVEHRKNLVLCEEWKEIYELL